VDRLRFFELLAEEVEESEWILLEYTLMTTHWHLLLTLRKCTLGSGFRRLQSRYAKAFNRRHERRGAVWQARYHDEMVLSDRQLFEAIRYIALNAPRARMVDAPEDWPWCSYGAAIGVHAPDPLIDEKALLGLFSPNAARARRLLKSFVEEKDPRMRWRQTSVRRASDAQK
jgi:REP element-mobilizing transposase RayT